MTVTELISYALAIVGLVVSVYFGRENRRLNLKIKSLDWDDVVLASKDLAKTISSKQQPDLIYSPDPRGGIIAILLRDSLNSKIPVISGATLWKGDFPMLPDLAGYAPLETTKWHVLVPETLKLFSDKKLLIVDDLTMSGDAMLSLKQHMIGVFGFSDRNVMTCTLVTSETAVRTKKAPSFYWKAVEHHDFFFPWGKAR